MDKNTELFEKLLKIVAKLRDPNGGCPWDLEQTHASLKPYLIEESYEALEAIDLLPSEGPQKLAEELGDVLLQVVLHSQIAAESKTFTMADVVKNISDKLVRRHPHVFGDTKVKDSAQVLQNWEANKKKELKESKSIVDGVPRGMPALIRSQRLGDKAARIGFDWATMKGVKEKILEEIREFAESSRAESAEAESAEELGDILFTLAQFTRKLGLNAEDLLHKANDKFTARFKRLEQLAGPDTDLQKLSAEELDRLWERAKIAPNS